MSGEPLVTVIIASYNHAPYVEASIRSVLNQSYPHIELLVIDDGSADNSVEVIRRLQEEHHFVFQTQTNKGLTATLNAAINQAKGSLIAPFGSDDIMLPDRIACQVEHMEDKPEVGICAGNMEFMGADGLPYTQKRPKKKDPFRRLDFDDMFLGRKPSPNTPTLLFRKEAIEKVGGFDPAIRLEDLYITLRITHAGYYIDCLDKNLARYRRHATNTYKNHRFMVDNILKIYAMYRDHPQYEFVRMRFLASMFLKTANRDKALAKELLAEIPFKYWNKKIWRGLGRLYFSFSGRG